MGFKPATFNSKSFKCHHCMIRPHKILKTHVTVQKLMFFAQNSIYLFPILEFLKLSVLKCISTMPFRNLTAVV